jgi:dipeptidyl aminopeptidase/acylaminoacyl peptidase
MILAASAPAPSQTPAKRPIRHGDYAAWRSLQGVALSPDGSVLVYAAVPQAADGEFVARNLRTGAVHRHPRGSRPAPLPAAAAARAPAALGAPHLFSSDGKVVAFPIYPPRAAAKAKGKSATTGYTLGLMTLADGKVTRIDRVSRYQLTEEGPPLLAYQKAPTSPAPDLTKGSAPKAAPKAKAQEPGAAAPRPATDLVLRNLSTGQDRTFPDVTEFSLTKDGRWLVYAAAGAKPDAHGVYAVAAGGAAPPLTLRSGPGRYSRLTWDEKQAQLVFFHAHTPTPPSGSTTPQAPTVRICHWKPAASSASAFLRSAAAGAAGLALTALSATLPAATDLVPAGKPALRPGHDFSDQGELSFSPDGRMVLFGVARPPAPKQPAAGGEKAIVELWHYRDDFIQSMQKARYSATRTYRAVFNLDDRTCRQLADDSLTSVLTTAGPWALGLDDSPYRTLVGSVVYDGFVDARLINVRTGASKLLLKKHSRLLSLSPAGKYVIGFDGKDWHSTAVPSGKRVNLTAGLGVSFANELNDVPGPAMPYGVAGWTKDDARVLIYDRYDVWQVAPDGSGAENLTAGLGRPRETSLRVVRLDASEKAFDPAKPLLLRAENERTRDTGFYRISLAGGPAKLLIMGARNYGLPVKARKADTLVLTVSTFYDFPDLFQADADFREVKRVTDANPQKAVLLWGKASLVHYKSADGLPLSGMLIKPEDFDPKKKYPMIVYIYERLSQNLHRFVDPQPGTSINPTYYASNGYLVLLPDIAYTVGYPGQSALKCVLPAIQAVVDQGCVNEGAIGIQGHSWGGYQTAYLVTQTTRFKAAAAGAPVCNMTSAYGGIRWGTGLPRQFQYETSQSRIGGSLWQYPTRFLENSPLFHADRVKTPLLMLHNDRDEAVPWQQGIEYYLALRRLGKEAYLFNYPGEGHGLRRRVNQGDYTVRMQEFFDHHLKGAPKPVWMEKGIPYTPPPAAAPAEGAPARAGGRRARS